MSSDPKPKKLDALTAAGRLTRPDMWQIPPQPDAGKVWDRDGTFWRRDEAGTDRWWSELHGRWVIWLNLLNLFGPLSATPPERGEQDD